MVSRAGVPKRPFLAARAALLRHHLGDEAGDAGVARGAVRQAEASLHQFL